MKRLCFFLSCIPSMIFALEEKPWFGNFLQFDFRSSYAYSFFPKVNDALVQLEHTFHNHVFNFGLMLTAPETWNWEVELEISDSTQVSWGYRSFAVQGRKLWLDDVCGDPVSLATGLVYRNVPGRMLHDVSTPYHAKANFEFNIALGKEWSDGPYWYFRVYGFGAVGQATKGSPWLRGDLFFWGNYCNCHQWYLYGRSYFGLGHRKVVDIDDFNGWADFAHQSIDLGIGYRYIMGIYGSLRFDYLRRVYAKSYPEQVNFFVVTYQLPFCPF